LPLFAASILTGAACGMAWLGAGMERTTPAETAAATANALMLNTIKSSFEIHAPWPKRAHGQIQGIVI
jgi:hypothetical protein